MIAAILRSHDLPNTTQFIESLYKMASVKKKKFLQKLKKFHFELYITCQQDHLVGRVWPPNDVICASPRGIHLYYNTYLKCCSL